MRSHYADYFNHDADAPDYDADVKNERNPIRAGYAELMTYIGSRVASRSRVLDLGTGTGNTILHLPADTVVTGVDVSGKMLEIAKAKLKARQVTLVQDDVLNYVTEADLSCFDVIVSTYTLHHLTPQERELLFSEIARKAPPAVRVIVGDLMYANEADKARIIAKYQNAHPDLADDFEDEFFWNVADAELMLQRCGWAPQWTQFSDLSWVCELDDGVRPKPSPMEK